MNQLCCLALLALVAAAPAAPPAMTRDAAPPVDCRDVKGMMLDDLLPHHVLTDTVRTDVDPGMPPEGDYLGWMTYTRDGSKLLLTNRGTDNITVFDVATMQVDTNIATGYYPGAIAVTDSLCIVTLGFADSIEVCRLGDWTRLAQLPAGEQPWVIRLSPDDSLAFVSCDITNTCEVYDLTTLQHVRTITDFPVFLSTYSWNSENGRNSFTFSDFGVHPDGDRLLAPNGEDTLFVFDIAGGPPVDTLTGFGDCRHVRFSGDNSVAVVVDGDSPVTAHRIDLGSMQVNASVGVAGHSVGMARDCGVNLDGTKAFISISGNQSAMVRFETGDYVTYSQTYSAFWIGVSHDHRLAISGQYRFTPIDFETELIVGQHQGNSQSVGAVSPASYQAAGLDPHRHEGVYFYSFDTASSPSYRGTTVAGEAPEGDCPRRVALTPDGSVAVAADVLSDNVSVIGVSDWQVDTILPAGDRPQNLAITGDGNWAVVTSTGNGRATVIDLTANEVAADLSCGGGAWTLAIAPSDSFAYTGNISANTVGVVRLDGASSSLVTQIPCGETGVVWAGYGIGSGLAVSPDGRWVLCAVSFDDIVKVIDTQTNTVVADLPVGDFPLQLRFNGTGTHAVVTNYQSDDFSVLRIQGDSSYVVGTFACGDGPARLAYDPVHDQVGICNYSAKTLTLADPVTGTINGTISYAAYGALAQVEFDELGTPVCLTMSDGTTPGHLHRGEDHVAMPAVPTAFDYCPATFRAAVAMPGPDWVSLIEWPPSGTHDGPRVTPDARRLRLRLEPNPASGLARVAYSLGSAGTGLLTLTDAAGRVVLTRPVDIRTSASKLVLDCRRLSSGVYLARLSSGASTATAKLVVQ